ncbi:MAG: leucine-rich repeat protein, partial [Coriobacteriales bacterium]
LTALEQAVSKFNSSIASGTKGVSLAKGKTFTVKTAAGTLKYRVTSKGKVTLVRATKTKAKKVTVNTVKYKNYTYKVTAIAKGAFKGAKTKRVVIGANVRTIGSKAFASAKKLAAVTIGKNVKKVGAKAFSKAKKLKKVTVKSRKLTKKSTVKNCLKGSKVKTVKLSKLGSKKSKVKRAFKRYAGKKGVVVK